MNTGVEKSEGGERAVVLLPIGDRRDKTGIYFAVEDFDQAEVFGTLLKISLADGSFFWVEPEPPDPNGASA